MRGAGAEARLEEFPAGTRTAVDAARAVGCEVGDIVKSLVFLADGRPVVVLVGGDRRADPAKIAAALGAERAEIAGSEEVERATGFGPGAVSPLGLPAGIEVLVDRGLLARGTVWAGAGSPSHVVGMAPAELARLARARAVDAVD